MSGNQSRSDRNESSQNRKSGRSGASGLQRNLSGGLGKGGGAPSPSLSNNRSFNKKGSNVQGGQSRGVSSEASVAAARVVPNGAHVQPPVLGAVTPTAGVTVKQTDASALKSTRAVPKPPSSNVAITSSDTVAPSTPVKAPGDASRSITLQFGSLSPGFMNGMQIPARTSSAPPNLDEQKRDQARHDSVKAAPTLPIPPVPKQPLPRKDSAAVDQSKTADTHPIAKIKLNVQASVAPSATQTQKPSVHVHSSSGISGQRPFHQPQAPPVQFPGPNPQMQSQGLTNTSMSMPMPIPMGNPAQVQQPVFVPGLQPHPMQPQGIIHQGQGLGFSSQMGPQIPPQMGKMGIGITPQFQQQQAGKYGGPRSITVKITHPKTHEELRLDKRADTHMDGGSTGPRSHPNVPSQSQPMPSYPPGHGINYYSNSYNPNPLFFPAQSSLPLTSPQITTNSQTQRFYNPVSQGPPTVSFVNPSSRSTFPMSKTGSPLHGIAEPSGLDHPRDVHNAIFLTPSASIQVTVKPPPSSHLEKVADSSPPMITPAVEKGGAPKILRPHGEASTVHHQRDSETTASLLQQSKSTSMTEPSKPSTAAPASVYSESLSTNPLSSTSIALIKESVSVKSSISTEATRRDPITRSSSIKDDQKKPSKKGHSQQHNEVCEQSTSVSSFPSPSLELGNSSDTVIHKTVEPTTTPASSGTIGTVQESTIEPLLTASVADPDPSDLKTDTAEEVINSKSLELIGAGIVVETERTKPENAGSEEREEILLPKESEVDDNSVEETQESINLTEQNSLQEGTATSSNTESLETAQKNLEEPVGSGREDDMLVNIATPAPTATHALNADKTSTSDDSSSRCDDMHSKETAVTECVVLDKELPIISEESSRHEGENTESNGTTLDSKDKSLVDANKAKSTTTTSTKKKRKELLQKADAQGTTSDLYNAYKGPDEKKEALTSAESIESTSSINSKELSDDASQEDGSNEKGEPDDWEDAADMSTPKLETPNNVGEDGNGVMDKKYSRDFLLIFSEQCIDLPDGFEIKPEIEEILTVSNRNVSRESYPSPGRNIDGPTGGFRPDRHGSGMGGDDRWSKVPGPLTPGREMRMDVVYGGGNVLGFRPGQGGNHGVLRNPRGPAPVQYAGGILGGPIQSMGSQGGMQRNSSDSDRWQRATGYQKGLMPYPQTPLQVMHKAERKYEVGKITDEEQAKQRQLKGILNKLTPQNFEKLFEQVKQVNIDNAGTLTGVISQIFDKALTEPTFCEMYANFCSHLAGELPDFIEDNEKITFKRLLLNKCQEEFERGEREEEEANRTEEEGEVKQSEEVREEKRTQARRRMLGNIRLIGELYKKKMLTERIMHECIKKLLGQYQSPDEEDVEALCKLMSTIGEIIDHPKAKEHMDYYFDMMAKLSNNMVLSSRVRFMLKDAIDLRKNKWQQRRKVEGPKKIEEVHRDAAQERHAQTSRLARGPSMGSSSRRGQPMDFAPRGSNMLPSPNVQMGGYRGLPQQLRGYGGPQDVRSDERHAFENRTLSVTLPQRPTGIDSITLGPQGGLARGMSIRGQPIMPNTPLPDMHGTGDPRRMNAGLNGYSSVTERTAYGPREDLIPRYIPERFAGPSAHDQSSMQERSMSYVNRDTRNVDRGFDRPLPTSPTRGRGSTITQNASSEKMLSEDRLRDMSLEAIKEFYSAKDEKEVALCIKDLNAPSFYPLMISSWVTDSFERKDMERDLLAKLLINLSKSRGGMLSQDHFSKGFESVLEFLEDAVNDAPKAAEFLGRIFAKVVLENVIPIAEIGRLIYEGGEEQGRLVEIGLASEVLGFVLEIIKSEKGDGCLSEILGGSKMRLESFRPPNSKKSWRLDKFM